MSLTPVESGEFHVTTDPDAVLIVYNLRGAIAMMIYDPVSKVGGLLHFPLPDSKPNPDQARERPATFADTGIPLFLQAAVEYGAQKERLVIQAAGGAQTEAEPNALQMGKKNYLAMRKILWKTGYLIRHEEIGGTSSRTAALQLGTGRVAIQDGSPSAGAPPCGFEQESPWLHAH